jgi:hypothetical protein
MCVTWVLLSDSGVAFAIPAPALLVLLATLAGVVAAIFPPAVPRV